MSRSVFCKYLCTFLYPVKTARDCLRSVLTEHIRTSHLWFSAPRAPKHTHRTSGCSLISYLSRQLTLQASMKMGKDLSAVMERPKLMRATDARRCFRTYELGRLRVRIVGNNRSISDFGSLRSRSERTGSTEGVKEARHLWHK